MYLILITHCIVHTLISEFTSHFNLLYKSCKKKPRFCVNTYGRKTSASALTKEICEYNSFTKKKQRNLEVVSGQITVVIPPGGSPENYRLNANRKSARRRFLLILNGHVTVWRSLHGPSEPPQQPTVQ